MFENGAGEERGAGVLKGNGARSYRADSGFGCLYVPTLLVLETFGLLAINEKSCVVYGMTCWYGPRGCVNNVHCFGKYTY
jgi:hypothetical protein